MNGPYLALVLVTGSRAWSDIPVMADALLDTWHDATQDGHSGITVLEGGATGADSIARTWAKQHRADGVDSRTMPADWDGPCADTCPPGHRKDAHGHEYCPLAGHRRNQQMVDQKPAIVLAFVSPCTNDRCRKPKPHGSHGVDDCLKRAKKAEIPVRRYEVTA
jgi:hypothetical protein